jgi:hypothetical protein
MANMVAQSFKTKYMNSSVQNKTKTSLFKKIAVKVRYGLTMQGVRSLLRKIGIEFSPFIIFQEGLNFAEIPEIKGIVSEYPCVLLVPEDMKEIGAINHLGFTEEKYLKHLEEGDDCIGIKHKGEIAAFMWIKYTEMNYKSTNISLKGDEAYLWNMYTRESYRGKNLAPYLRYISYKILKEKGRDKLYSISDYFNSPAVIFKKKLEAKKLKLILFVRLFNKFERSYNLKTYSS